MIGEIEANKSGIVWFSWLATDNKSNSLYSKYLNPCRLLMGVASDEVGVALGPRILVAAPISASYCLAGIHGLQRSQWNSE